ncbi:helix-turn-helix domain-containing protein [Fimbriiglobus ruber]|uniref:helix-turn-helix domain-containing protein n=1 Tax=Fimbriiglobus ruber TaxID=1908690 RepID=UPI000B4B9B2A
MMNTTNEATKPLTIKEAAERLSVSRGLVYALCRAGRIRHERHGTGRGTLRIEPAALDEYRATCCRETGANDARPATANRAKGRGTTFGHLDGTRLLEAWRKQGAV